MKVYQMKLRLRVPFLMLLLSAFGVFSVSAQEKTKEPDKKETVKKNAPQPQTLDFTKDNPTAEQVAESAIFIYGGFGGRAKLEQIRKTTVERGKSSITNPDGTVDNISYDLSTVRGENLDKDKYRLNQDFPNARYSIIYNGDKTFGLFNETIFEPKEESAAAFQNQVRHGLDALLRYKENGSKVEFIKRDKILGVEFFIVDVTDKANRKTRFYVSTKTLRVMILEYEEGGVKYKRRFYDYNISQGTLVAYRRVLWADDKIIEETDVQTITFGQKLDDALFAVN